MLDGGRIAHGLWGRRPSGRVGAVTLLLLSLGGLVNTLALFWALLVRQCGFRVFELRVLKGFRKPARLAYVSLTEAAPLGDGSQAGGHCMHLFGNPSH